MKIFFDFLRKPQGYVRSLQNEEKHKKTEERDEKGRPLTVILCFALLICCGTWSWTVWYAAQKSVLKFGDSEFIQEESSRQCVLIPHDLR